jgi:membrane protease YdiL (CAAX protease family)
VVTRPDPETVAPLLERMPTRRRAALEIVFVTAFVLAMSLTTSALLAAALVVAGLVLVRPWSPVHGSIARRAITALVLVPALVVPALLERADDAQGRRIGVQLERAAALPGEPPIEGGIARTVAGVPGSPGAGHVRVGDRIVALGGRALDAADPVGDVVARVGSTELPVDTSIDVLRDGARVSVPLHVPWPTGPAASPPARALRTFVKEHLFVALALRGVCLIVLVLLLARADGQGPRQLGLVRAGAARESALGLPGAFGAFATSLLAAIPIGLVGLVAGDALKRDMSSRAEGLSTLVAQGTGLRGIGAFAITAVFAGAFEELVFRGFLVPRLRHVTGSWAVAIVLANVAFASGHLYEGVAALFQTFALGVYFSVLLLWRGRIESAIVAHASFNVAMFAFISALEQSGGLRALERTLQK